MVITQNCDNGGTLVTNISITPKFIFTRKSDGETLVFEPGQAGKITFTDTAGSWVMIPNEVFHVIKVNPGLLVDGDLDGVDEQLAVGTSDNFHFGIKQDLCTNGTVCEQAALRSVGEGIAPSVTWPPSPEVRQWPSPAIHRAGLHRHTVRPKPPIVFPVHPYPQVFELLTDLKNSEFVNIETMIPAAARLRGESDSSALRSPQAPVSFGVSGSGHWLYRADPGDTRFYGRPDWYQVYNLNQGGGTDVPYGITYIAGFSGDDGTDVQWETTDRYHLIEAYDTHLCDPVAETCTPQCGADAAIHSTYLGGVLVNLGKHNPNSSGGFDFVQWSVNVKPGEDALFYVPSDGQVTFVHRMGWLDGVSGVFVPEPAKTNPNGLSLVYGTEGMGAGDIIGSREPDTLFADGYGSGSDSDRIYTHSDGPLAFGGGTDPGVLYFEVRGRPMNDCNENGAPDAFDILCNDFINTTGPNQEIPGDCATTGLNRCEYFVDLDTNGHFFNNPLFSNPLNAIACETECLTAGVDANTDGIIDDCLSGDCDSNGLPDNCDLDCSDTNAATDNLCSVDFPGTCGTAVDCSGNGKLDRCEMQNKDCNNNGVLDICDITGGTSSDCDLNGKLDGCQLAAGEPDCDNNGTLDRCERPLFFDCNQNGEEDLCDIFTGASNDLDGDSIPDECPSAIGNKIWYSLGTPIGGFEDLRFVIGSPLDGLDVEPDSGSGDTFFDSSSTWMTVAGGLNNDLSTCTGESNQAIQSLGTDEMAGINNFLFSEYFIGGPGDFPPITSTQTIHFDFQVGGDLNTGGFDFQINLDRAGSLQTSGYVLRLTSTGSDLGTNGFGNPDDDATPGQIWIFNPCVGFADTGIVVDGNCHHVEFRLNNATQMADLFIDNIQVASDILPIEPLNRIDFFGAGSITHLGGEWAGGTATLKLDNWEVIVTGGAMPCSEYRLADGSTGEDCDGNGICDHFEMAGNDVDNNGVLDACQGSCDDCNNNLVLDAVEIAAGSAPDVNPMNGVIDWCEGTTHAENFEAPFATGSISQRGWTELTAGGVGASEIIAAGGGGAVFTTGFLAVKADPANPPGVGLVFSPRRDDVGDGDIELWSWDMSISSTDMASLYVEIMDLCEDGGTLNGDVQALRDAVNTGIEWRFDPAFAGIDIYMLEEPAPGQRLYQPTAALAIDFDVVPGPFSAGLRIVNSRGQVQARWAATQAELLNVANQIFLTRETQGVQAGDPTGVGFHIRKGGDRQLMIRVDNDPATANQPPPYGSAGTTEFWFDTINYQTWADCDRDGVVDSDWLLINPTFDANTDGIPDACQDCNNDCGGFPVASIACLDPEEIAANGDCNSNGLPDECDIDATLPDNPMFAQACWDLANVPLADPCRQDRKGGGSLDCNTNGIPDE